MKGVVPSNHRRGGWVSKKVSKLTKVRGCELANSGDEDVGVNYLFFCENGVDYSFDIS